MKPLLLALFTAAVAHLPTVAMAQAQPAAATPGQAAPAAKPDAAALYQQYCAACHGAQMQGTPQYSALRKRDWLYGGSRAEILRTVNYGIAGKEMVPWGQLLPKEQIEALVDYIIASRDTMPAAPAAKPDTLQLKDYTVKIERLVETGFRSYPWGIEFVDNRRALITEIRGGLRWLVDGKLDPEPIRGLPETIQYGTGGMMDLALDPDYALNGWVYIGYVHPLGDSGRTDERPAMTRIIRGRVVDYRWVQQETLFDVPHDKYFVNRGRWGCRLLFDKAGFLYFTIGDIRENLDVQDLDKPAGKTYRINRDGSIPKDNPYAGRRDAIQAIYTVGNRNVQGIDQHPVTGAIWGVEHGPMGGDELNVLKLGKNYGWPVISYGIDYDGKPITDLTAKEGMEQPIKFWKPSPGICALEFYTGDLFPKWKNQAFATALVFQEIKRLKLDGEKVEEEEVFMKGYGRVRDIKTGPEGALYVLLNEPDQVLRLTPAK
jgi:glucose/arabinose dehydrogenase